MGWDLEFPGLVGVGVGMGPSDATRIWDIHDLEPGLKLGSSPVLVSLFVLLGCFTFLEFANWVFGYVVLLDHELV